ncbi:DUF6850 family outer membrane beta-barrel protein [Hymenobacter terrenus]|uniref:DUF6850 family outer membrane beta-barrel protein n=1 Tax=Hymenobacter terrenus TaxID=1629124 RepID=UPI000B1D4C4E|nr:DUF6850 family outer membrane beta-barrel protein [Hymenobacter terrenus]
MALFFLNKSVGLGLVGLLAAAAAGAQQLPTDTASTSGQRQVPPPVAAPDVAPGYLGAGFGPDTLLPVAATNLGQVLLTEFRRQAALLPLAPLGRYARTEVGYGREQGDFRRAQDPTRSQTVGLRTEGLRDWKGWRLWGQFEFERQWHDSIRWSLTPNPAPSRPYYLAAGRPGSWDNQVYSMQAAGARHWLGGRLTAGLNTAYNVGNYARSNDPRPEMTRHQLRVGASVGYALRPAWLLALGYTYGYGSDITRTQFGSDLSQQGSDTPFTIYDVLGYGFLLEARYNLFRSQRRLHHGSFSVQHTCAASTYLLTVAADRSTEEFRKRLTSSGALIDDLVGTYTLTAFDLRAARFQQAAPGRQHYQRLLLNLAQGQDENNTFRLGNNYRYTSQHTRLEAGTLRRHPAGHLTEYGGGLYYRAERRADGTTVHRRQTRRAGLDLQARHYHALLSGWRAIVGAQGGAEWNAASSLSVPVQQQNRFSRNVVFPDHAYDLQHTGRAGLTLGVERAAAPGVRVRVLAEGNYLTPLTTRTAPAYPPPFTPNGARWDARLSLQVFH